MPLVGDRAQGISGDYSLLELAHIESHVASANFGGVGQLE